MDRPCIFANHYHSIPSVYVHPRSLAIDRVIGTVSGSDVVAWLNNRRYEHIIGSMKVKSNIKESYERLHTSILRCNYQKKQLHEYSESR